MPNDWDAWMDARGWRGVLRYAFVDGSESGLAATREEVQWFRDSYGIEYDVLYDAELRYEGAYPEGFPTLYIVNPDNMLIWHAGGGWFEDDEQMNALLMAVCEEGAANDPDYVP